MKCGISASQPVMEPAGTQQMKLLDSAAINTKLDRQHSQGNFTPWHAPHDKDQQDGAGGTQADAFWDAWKVVKDFLDTASESKP